MTTECSGDTSIAKVSALVKEIGLAALLEGLVVHTQVLLVNSDDPNIAILALDLQATYATFNDPVY